MNNASQEIDNMIILSNLVKNKITQHFVTLYQTYKTDNIIESDSNLTDTNKLFKTKINNFGNNIDLLIMEKFDGNIIKKISYITNILDVRYDNELNKQLREIHAQMFISILTFHIYFGFHGDCQYKNFFYKTIPYTDNEYFHYEIFGINYYIKNNGYIIVLGDYGTSIHYNGLITNQQIQTDYSFLTFYKNYFDRSYEEEISKNLIDGIYNIENEKTFFENIIINKNNDIFLKELPSNPKILNEFKISPPIISLGGKKIIKKVIKKYN